MQFCKVADITDWQDQEFQAISSLLEVDGFISRKIWEYIQVYRGLDQLGLLNGESRAIGLGVGRERLIYAFTNVCAEVVATDLYNSQNWQTAAMPVDEVYEKNPFPYQRDRLVVKHMDMTSVEYPDASFDFVWSCCSIEHVNSFKDLHKVYQEIHRILKPGGIAALTTEYNMTDRHSYEPNMLFTDRYWIEKWLTGEDALVQGFELLDQPKLSIPTAPGNTPQPRHTYQKTSVPIYSRDIVLNSISFFLRKSGDFSRPYDDNWLPQPLRIYLDACDKQRIKDFAGSEALLKSLLTQDSIDARLKVAATRRLVVSLQSQNKTEDVIAYCKAIVPLCAETEDTDHILPLAHQCKKAGLWDEAKVLYERVAALPGPRDVQVVRSILGQAECLEHLKKVQAALKTTNKALQLFPISRITSELPSIYYHQGLYNERLCYYRAAITAYQKAIDVASPNSKLYNNSVQRLNTCSEKLKERSILKRLKQWANRTRKRIFQ